MKIDTNDYMTIGEATEAIGASQRAFQRAMDRAGKDKVTATFWGHRVVIKKKLPLIEKYYFKRGTDRAHQIAVASGSKGGKQKHLNAQTHGGESGN